VAPKVAPSSSEDRRLWVNFPVSGEPLEIYLQLRGRGIVHSTRDAFVQGLRCLQAKVVEMDLKVAQLKASQRLNEEF